MLCHARFASAAVIALGLPMAALGQSLTLNTGSFTSSPGGEFNATPSAFPSTPVALTVLGYFETFCLEHSENFSPGGSYLVDLQTYAVGGGGGAVAGQDPLDERTAYLYSLFITGSLPGYDYANSLGERQADAGRLQRVIWFLEQEIGSISAGEETTWYNLSAAGIGQGLGDVRVANLYRVDGNGARSEYQSQIVMFPTPGAASLLVLGGLTASRRRR